MLRAWKGGEVFRIDLRSSLKKLRGFFQSIRCRSGFDERSTFYCKRNGFGISAWPDWPLVFEHIIRARAMKGHVWSPVVVPFFERMTQPVQVILAFAAISFGVLFTGSPTSLTFPSTPFSRRYNVDRAMPNRFVT